MDVRVPLEINGFYLREFSEDDLPRLCLLAGDYEIWRRVTDLFPHPYDEAAALRWLDALAEQDPPRNLAIAGPTGLVGGVGLLLSNVPNFAHDGELGYWLGREYWGLGLMTAAVRAFVPWAAAIHGLRRLTARVYAGNVASMRVVEKCGFVREGVLRQAVRKEDQWLDLHVFGRLVG
ncbi:MAG TPA: GNAT family protein [Candidatus Krumholzibacteria bacterium]|nr:GNAT family protein [Candidatus Krumholzibacteria bacterium]HPD72422.1 GNAT family protein [Candidatus Krumholzibacteria bacterium]HRY40646.1 GNAT family protein [Candidatus Krumholzibacteria bacterium]